VLSSGITFGLVAAAAMIILAVFYGVGNNNPAVTSAIQSACNEAITSSPFTDVTLQQLRDDCVEDNQYYLNRSVIGTAIRAAFQVHYYGKFINVDYRRHHCDLVGCEKGFVSKTGQCT
jgi:hypothetical protein